MLRAKKFLGIKMYPAYKFLRDVHISQEDNILERIDSVNFYTYYFSLSYNINLQLLKQKTFNYCNNIYDFSITKDTITDTIFLTSDKLIIFYINKDDIEEFSLCYMYSSFYKFVIYDYYRGYMAICLSHTIDDIDDNLLRFYLMNNSNPKYIILSHFIYKWATEFNKQEENIEEDVEEDVEQDVEQEINRGKIINQIEILDDIVTICKPKSFIILNKNVQSYLDDDVSFDVNLYILYDTIGYGNVNLSIQYFVKLIFMYIDCYKTSPINYLCI
jgi:hypothetical protein